MNIKFALLPTLAAVLLALPMTVFASSSACDATAGNLVQNCGFETGDFTGWTLSGNDVPIQSGTLYGVEGTDPDGTAPNSGSSQAYFGDSTTNPITLSQNITTAAGASYTISFYLAQDTAVVTPYGNFFDASFGSGALDMSDVGVNGYTEYSFTGVAGSGSSMLSLTLGNDLGYFQLDDFSVTANATVPEPSTAALVLIAVLALMGLRLRSRLSFYR